MILNIGGICIKRISVDILSFLPIALLCIASGTKSILLPIMAALIHEAGHLLFGAILKMDISSMEFSFGGAIIRTNGFEKSSLKKAAVLLSGSGANLIAAGILRIMGGDGGFIGANLVLGIFNMLPVMGLDGGSALELILDKFLIPERAYAITRFVSWIFLIFIWAAAIFLMIFSQGNITMYCVFWGLFLANYKAFS